MKSVCRSIILTVSSLLLVACGDGCDVNCRERATYISSAVTQAGVECNRFEGVVKTEKIEGLDGVLLVCRCSRYDK